MARLAALALSSLLALVLALSPGSARRAAPPASPAPPGRLEAGFAEEDITPAVKPGRPVYLAGFGQNRPATGVHDPLVARAVVLRDGRARVALVSLDLVGLFLGSAERVRQALPGFDHVVVTCTHNHEGPDTLGLWGRSPFQSGIDRDYLASVERAAVQAVKRADQAARPVTAEVGAARAPELLHDGRLPQVKHDDLVTLALKDAGSGKLAGLVVQWNCHPETLGAGNTLVSSDFVGPAVRRLRERNGAPVVYLTGTVGGLMTSLHVPIQSRDGRDLKDGTFEKTERYAELLADVAGRAISGAKAARLTPVEGRRQAVYVPLDNKQFLVGYQLGVLSREAYRWTGERHRAEPAGEVVAGTRYAVRTEVGYLRLGELQVACIPGEIYPELVLGRVEDPAVAGADFPDAPVEPGIYAQMPGPHRMIVGLANDEVGYILPRRQWDEKAPFCYGLKKAQYGEVNSMGPDTAPVLCATFRDLVKGKTPGR